MSKIDAYARRVDPAKLTRMILVIPNDEVEAVDEWGVPSGMPSRVATVRFLIKKGLEAVKAGAPAAGSASQA